MALSSKRIIEIIYRFEGDHFTADDIMHVYETQREKKKGKPKKLSREWESIIQTLLLLKTKGFLEKKRNTYSINGLFPGSGKVSVADKSKFIECENITLKIADDSGFSFRKDDIAEFIVTDVKKSGLSCRITKVRSARSELMFARVETKTKDIVILRLLDIPGEQYAALPRGDDEPSAGDYVSIKFTGKTLSGRAECEMIERFESGSEELDFKRIVIRHNLPGEHGEYADARRNIKDIPPSEMKNRRDFTNLLTITIDGIHAKDFDDALSLERTDTGYTLYVHIADVSAFVEINSTLDREAMKRGTSYYLGDKVIPMLPEFLSNNQCSLRPNEDRLTLSAIMNFNNSGVLTKYEFTRGIIRSAKRCTYDSANEMLDHHDGSDISVLVNNLYSLAMILKKRRLGNGRIDLELNDFELEYDEKTFTGIVQAKRLKSHILVEESMLSANEVVSLAIRQAEIPSLYRVHEPMSDEQINKLKKFLDRLGITFKPGKNTGLSLQNIIEKSADKEYLPVLSYVILRSMMQAFYGTNPLGHFGLGFKDYTHFTSPIRRYPDLIVHRVLKSLIDKGPHAYSKETLDRIGEESSALERTSVKAERDLFRLKGCRVLEGRTGEEFSAMISGVSKYGLYVTIDEPHVEGMVPLRMIADDYYSLSEDGFSVIGRRNGKTYTIGDKAQVRLIRVDLAMLYIDFEFITNEDKKYGNSAQKKHFAGKGNSRNRVRRKR